jgi:predicted RNase H-like HicB family nuclease
MRRLFVMKQVYPVIFTQLNDEKNTVLIEVPDLEILTEGLGMADAVEMARDAIGLKGNGSYKNNQSNCKDVHLKCDHNVWLLVKELLESWLWTYGRNKSSQVHNFG